MRTIDTDTTVLRVPPARPILALLLSALVVTAAAASTNPPPTAAEQLRVALERGMTNDRQTCTVRSAQLELRRGLRVEGIKWTPTPANQHDTATTVDRFHLAVPPHLVAWLATRPPGDVAREMATLLFPDPRALWPLLFELDGVDWHYARFARFHFKRAATVELSLEATPSAQTADLVRRVLGSGGRLNIDFHSDSARTELKIVVHAESAELARNVDAQVAAQLTGFRAPKPGLQKAVASAKHRVEGRAMVLVLEAPTVALLADLAPAIDPVITPAVVSFAEPSSGSPPARPAATLDVALEGEEAVTEGPLPRHLELDGAALLPVPAGARVKAAGRTLSAQPRPASIERLVARALATGDPSVLAHLDQDLIVLPRPLPARVQITHALERAGALRHYVSPLVDRVEASSPAADPVRLRVTAKQGDHAVFSPTHGVQGVTAPGRPLEAELPSGATRLELFVRPPQPAGGSAEPLVEVFPWTEDDGAGQLVALIAPGSEVRAARLPSDVVFVLDVSGSMSGGKLDSAKKALEACLTRLAPEDRFAVLKFSDAVEAFEPALVPADPAHIGAAVKRVRALDTEGGTNLEGGAMQGLEIFQKDEAVGRSRLLLFLTDGQPSTGVTDEETIVKNVAGASRRRVALHPVGIGEDVNTRLLDRIAAQGGGATTYIRPSENIEVALARLYASLAQPVATGVTVSLAGGTAVHLQPERAVELYRGSWLVATARYQARRGTTPELHVAARTGSGPVRAVRPIQPPTRRWPFVPALVAQRRLAALMDAARTAPLEPLAEEEVLTLSLAHGIETPLTRDILRARQQSRSALGTDVTHMLDHTRRLRSRVATSFKAITGAQALEEAVSIGKLRTLSMAASAGGNATQADRGGKRFVHRPGRGWVDVDYRGAGPMRTLTFGSPEHAAELAAHPELGAWLSLDQRVTVATPRGDLRVGPAPRAAPAAVARAPVVSPAVGAPAAPAATAAPFSVESALAACLPEDVGRVTLPRAAELAPLEAFLTGWDLGALKLWDAQRTYPRFLDDLSAQLGLDRRALAGQATADLDAGAVFLFGDLGFSTASRLGVLVAPRTSAHANALLTGTAGERTVTIEGESVRAITTGTMRSYRWTAPDGRVMLIANDPWMVERVIRARRGGLAETPDRSDFDARAAACVTLTERALQRVIGEVAGQTAAPVCRELREKLARVQALHRADHPLATAKADLELLQRTGYLPELPLCPRGGTLELNATVECSVHTRGEPGEDVMPSGARLPLRRFGLEFTPAPGGMQMTMEVTPGDAAGAEALSAFPVPVPLRAAGALPAGAFVLASADLAPYIDELSRPAKPDAQALVPGLAASLARVEAITGVSAVRDVFPWLGRELAVGLYAAPGTEAATRLDELRELPDVAVVLALSDAARATRFVEAQLARLDAAPANVRVRVERRAVAGGHAWTLSLPFVESQPSLAIAGAQLFAASDPATLDRALAAAARPADRISASRRGAAAAVFLADPAHVALYAETDRIPGLGSLVANGTQGMPAGLARTPVLAARVVFDRSRIRTGLLAVSGE